MPRHYTEKELYEIASIFYNIETHRNPTVFAGIQPLYGSSFYELAPDIQKRTVEGLKQRIDRETLLGYLDRKKKQLGAAVIEPVESELAKRGLLSTPEEGSHFAGEQSRGGWWNQPGEVKPGETAMDAYKRHHTEGG
jgi:hypothetical protein